MFWLFQWLEVVLGPNGRTPTHMAEVKGCHSKIEQIQMNIQ